MKKGKNNSEKDSQRGTNRPKYEVIRDETGGISVIQYKYLQGLKE